MSIPLGLSGAGSALLGSLANHRELTRKTPSKRSFAANDDALVSATDRYIQRTVPDNPLSDLDINDTTDAQIAKGARPFSNLDAYASYGPAADTGVPSITINPNTDAVFGAHELGHVAFGQSGFGKRVQDVRGKMDNGKVGTAVKLAAAIAPAGVAYLTPGDDDLAASVATSAVLAAPTLIDEIEGSRRGLSIMKEAGMPATAGQRARLAGGLLTYLGVPLAMAASGNLTGNYLETAQSSGTLMPS